MASVAPAVDSEFLTKSYHRAIRTRGFQGPPYEFYPMNSADISSATSICARAWGNRGSVKEENED